MKEVLNLLERGYKMSLEVKVEVFHKGRITPSSPTPHHLRNFRLSIFDQFSPTVRVPLILFYPNNSDIHEAINTDLKCLVVERTKLLKRSLSETLTHFYPFAGRIQDEASVCCNEKGAMFLEAQVNCSISMALEKPDLGFTKDLIPTLQSTEGDSGQDMLLVQANFFECGGVAIGVSISHKISDAFTLGIFLNSWSGTSRGLQLPSHRYVGTASCFPPLELFKPHQQFGDVPNERCTTRRLLFESSKIECLKSIAASTTVQNPTRVEVVSALLWKCAMQASSANSGFARPSSSAWVVIVNMRKILAQSAEHLMGNLLGYFAAVSKKGESNDDLRGLVAAMRKAFLELKVKYGANGIGVDDVCRHLKGYDELLQKDDIECYCSTSWCRLPFHETNFGWGKPLMSNPARAAFKNLSVMKDTSDRSGIEVLFTLKEDDMVLFENNEELLAYASLNPSVI